MEREGEGEERGVKLKFGCNVQKTKSILYLEFGRFKKCCYHMQVFFDRTLLVPLP